MAKEKLDGWNEYNDGVFCMVEPEDTMKAGKSVDANSFNCDNSFILNMSLLQLRLLRIEYQLILFPASC